MSLPITNPSNNAQTASTVEAAVSDAIAIITNTRVPKPPWETVQQHPHIRPSERHIEELESYAFPGCTPETKPWGLTINLSSLYIGSDQVARIGRTLALNQTVTTLDLSMCDMYSSGCEALMTCLKRNYILKHLSLCGNKIGPRGAVAIAEYLSMDNTGILESAIAKTEASFLKCNSTTSGVNTRSQGGENSSSEYLTTAAASPPITISPVGFHNLQPPSPVYIPPNKALNSIPYDRKWEYDKYGQNIPLGGRDVTDSASKRVIQSLTNSSGKADTEVSSEGGKGDKVLHGAEKSTVVGLYPDIRKDAMTKDTRPPPPCYLRCPLQSLGLSFNAIGDEGVICIMNSLRTNRELKSLNLRGNNITNLGAFAVLDALQDHYTLEEDLLSHAAKLKMIASMGKKGKSKNKGDGAKGKGPTPQKIENDDRPEKEGETREFKLARVNKEAPKPPKSCLPDRLRFDIDTLREQKHMQKKHNEALVKCGLADMSSDIAIPEVKERDSSVERNDECSADIGSNQRRENISQNNVSSRRIVPPSAPELFQVLFRFLSGVYIPSLTSPAFIVPFSGDDNPAVLSVKEKKKALSDVLIAAGVTTNKMAESLLDMVSHGESYNAAQTLKTVLPQHDDNDETSAADTPRTKCINLSDVSTTTAAAAATCGNRFDAPTGNKERSKAFSARWKGMKVEQRLEFIQFNFPQFSSAAAIFLLGQRGNESRCEITNPYTPNPLLYNAMKILSAGNLTLKLSLLTPYHHDDSNISKYNNMIAVNCSRVAYDLLYHPVSHESKSKYPSSDVYVSKGDSQRRRSTSADDTLSKSVKDQEKRSSTEQLTTGDVNTLVLEQSIATTQQKMRTYTQEYEEATEVKKDTDKLLITSLMECKEYPSLLENTGGFFYPTLAVSPTAEGIKVPSYHVLHTPRAPDVSHDGNATPSVILSTRSTDGQILACDIANSNISNIQSLSLFPQTRIALASIISASGVQFIQKQMIDAMRFNAEVQYSLDRVRNYERSQSNKEKNVRLSEPVNKVTFDSNKNVLCDSSIDVTEKTSTEKTVLITQPILQHKNWTAESSISKGNDKKKKKSITNNKAADKAKHIRKMVSKLEIKETGYGTGIPSSHVTNLAIDYIPSLTTGSLYQQNSKTIPHSEGSLITTMPTPNSKFSIIQVTKEAKIAAYEDYHLNNTAFRLYGKDVDEKIKDILQNRSNINKRIKEIESEIEHKSDIMQDNIPLSFSCTIRTTDSIGDFDKNELSPQMSCIINAENDEKKCLYDEIRTLHKKMTVLNNELMITYDVKKNFTKTVGSEIPSVLRESQPRESMQPSASRNDSDETPNYICTTTAQILSDTLRDNQQNMSLGFKKQSELALHTNKTNSVTINKPPHFLPVELQFLEKLASSSKGGRGYGDILAAKEAENRYLVNTRDTCGELPDKVAYGLFQVKEVRPEGFQPMTMRYGRRDTDRGNTSNAEYKSINSIRGMSTNIRPIGEYEIIEKCTEFRPRSLKNPSTIERMGSSLSNSKLLQRPVGDGTGRYIGTEELLYIPLERKMFLSQLIPQPPPTSYNRRINGNDSQTSIKDKYPDDSVEFERLPPPLPLPTIGISDLHPLGVANRRKQSITPAPSIEERIPIPNYAVAYVPLASILIDLMRSPLYVLVDPLTAFLMGRGRGLRTAVSSNKEEGDMQSSTIPVPLDPSYTPEGLAVIIANHLKETNDAGTFRMSKSFVHGPGASDNLPPMLCHQSPLSSLSSTSRQFTNSMYGNKIDHIPSVEDPLSSSTSQNIASSGARRISYVTSSHEGIRKHYPVLCSTLKRAYDPPKISRNKNINSIWLQMNDDIDPILQYRIQQCLSMRCPIYPPALTKNKLKQLLSKRKKNHEEIPIEYADMISALIREEGGEKGRKKNPG